MAPKAPKKPKLPRPKKTLGQHVKDQTRKSVASGLSKGFGVLGQAVAKKYLAPPPSASRVRANSQSSGTDKNIQKKKIKDTSAEDAILDSAKQVTAAIDIISLNAARGFAATSRQADIMGEQVAGALNELTGILDRLLYQKKPGSDPGPSGGAKVPNESSEDDSGGGFGTGFRNRGRARAKKNPNKKKPRTAERTKKAKARLSRMKGGPKSPFKGGGIKARGVGPFNLIFSGIDAWSEYQTTGNLPRAATGMAGDLAGVSAGGWAGGVIGGALTAPLGGIGAIPGMWVGAMLGGWAGKAVAQTGYDYVTKEGNKVTVGEKKIIHKMTYKAETVTFKAKNSIEFKSRFRQSSGSGGTQKSAGFLNSTVDKLMGTGSGSMGRVNNAFGYPGGGSGGGGSGGGGGSSRGAGGDHNHASSTPSGTPAVSSGPSGKEGLFNPITASSLSGRPGSDSASMGKGKHQGVDMMAPKGSPVYASKDGRIVKIGTDNFGQPTVTIKHPDGTYSRYLHMGDVHVKVGDPVEGGKQIGTSGSANGVDHLHFERWSQAPNAAGNGLINPRTEFGWDKSTVGGQSPSPDSKSAVVPQAVPPAAVPQSDTTPSAKSSAVGGSDPIHPSNVLAKLGQREAGEPYRVGTPEAAAKGFTVESEKGNNGSTLWAGAYPNGHPVVAVNPRYRTEGTASYNGTLQHEYGHAGQKSLIGNLAVTPAMVLSNKWAKPTDNNFEEIRNRLQDLKYPTPGDEMRETDNRAFIKDSFEDFKKEHPEWTKMGDRFRPAGAHMIHDAQHASKVFEAAATEQLKPKTEASAETARFDPATGARILFDGNSGKPLDSPLPSNEGLKFGGGIFGGYDNDSKDIPEWKPGAWNDFRRSDNIEDRRDYSTLETAGSALKGLLSPRTTMEEASQMIQHPLTQFHRLIPIPPANSLSDQAGTLDLDNQLGEKERGQTKYQDSQNEKLDHSKIGESQSDYSDYLGVTSDSEYR